MKKIIYISALFLSLFFIYSFTVAESELPAEDFAKCKVLRESINKEYDGDCKKGLAHGSGTAKGEEDYYQGSFKKGLPYGKGKYVYGNGEFYQGDFKDGVRHGEGVMYTINPETGAVEKGKMSVWKNDEFVMEIMEEKYKIVRQRNLVSVSAKKKDEERNSVEVYIKNAVEIRDVAIISNVGSMTKFRDDKYVIQFVEFPINVVINYTSANKFNTSRITTVVEIEIESPGDWYLTLNH